jgi:hypothetical protein
MSVVTDPKNNRLVFCEGETNSPDVIFWSQILVKSRFSEAKYRCQIIPMGGKQAAKNFAKGYSVGTNESNWLILRDRDLDIESNPSLIRREKIIFTGKTCIESYFISPNLMQNFLETEKLVEQQKIDDHNKVLQDVVQSLSHYQATRWALQDMRSLIANKSDEESLSRSGGQFDLPNRWTKKDGTLPQHLNKEGCEEEAVKLCRKFKNIFEQVNLDYLHQRIEHYVLKFDAEDFQREKYLDWFHGKDVMSLWIQKYQNVGYDKYCKWAAYNVDWQKQFVDLVEIQKVCQS